jgi:glutamate/tyrosine decarboxylase-like PLP-dependent enzyme
MSADDRADLERRDAPLEMSPEAFREAGHRMVDELADFLGSIRERPVAPDLTPSEVRALLPQGGLPEEGQDPRELLAETVPLVLDRSLLNGHPRFFGYITSSATPIGALADLLAAAVNPNMGGWQLSPLASEIEGQCVRWIAEMLGFPAGAGGLLVSGGNMANFVGFLAARRAKCPEEVRSAGLDAAGGRLIAYVSKETHTWIQKAADLFGHGTDAIRWIDVDDRQRMDLDALRRQIHEDRAAGHRPFLVVGTAGSVGTGAVDPLPGLAAIACEEDLWFHVDGAYGAFAAIVPEVAAELEGMAEADSIACDPHKWLYAPLEAGCTLVRDPEALPNAFSYTPSYYRFTGEDEEPRINYYEQGFQNSRGFRALKVWLGLRQAGRAGYLRAIRDDIRLAGELARAVGAEPRLELASRELSIVSFRYVPDELRPGGGGARVERKLNELNEELLRRLKDSGEAFLSNVSLGGRFLLRACIVNFRTSLEDVEALPGIVVRHGEAVWSELDQLD